MTTTRLGDITLGALGVPTVGSLVVASVVTAGLAYASFLKPCLRHPGAPELAEPPPAEEPAIEPHAVARRCDADGITTVVVRGQFTAGHAHLARPGDALSRVRSATDQADQFSIQLPGRAGSYVAITDSRGYFEMHIPREDVSEDLCSLAEWHSFSDDSLTLTYYVEFE